MKCQSVSSILQAALRHQQEGELVAAVAAYDQVLELKPDFAEVHNNRGNALSGLGWLEDALASFDAALRFAPTDPITHFNRGNVLRALALPTQALDAYEAALNLNAEFAEAHLNLGLTLKGLGRLEDALTSLDAALRLKPGLAAAHNNRGIVLKEMGRLDEALAAYDAALSLRPDFAKAHNNRGGVLKDLGRSTEVLAACDAALHIQPDLAEAHNMRGYILLVTGQVDEAVAAHATAVNLKPDYAQAHSNRLFALLYREKTANGVILSAAQQFGTQFDQPTVGINHPNARQPERRLRVGYVSGDFRCHPVGRFLQSVLPYHDPAEVEVYCYSTQAARDDLTDRLEACVHRWKTLVGLDDRAAAARIRADAIDILIDLSGHTAHNRLLVFAQRPAPVQVTWLGYSGTTGLAAMDYILADRFVVPDHQEQNFTEQVWRLPNSYLCFTPPDVFAEVEPPQSQARSVVFGSFNNLAKLSPQTVALWAKVLDRVPESQLILKDKALTQMPVRREVLSRFAAQGVDFGRLQLMGSTSRLEHFARYNRIDVALDPTPYAGTTTTAEALWMGTPVVTFSGETWVARVGESILNTIGLPELVAHTEEDYIAMAATLAADAERRAWLRMNLRAMLTASPFCDGQGFTRDLEAAYRGMWRRWCAGENKTAPDAR
ncbi:tetratricopeptide repeat protein [Rhabdochromatium marinum]|uniref:O-linked N-acetylglucosamine transferase, SPINDLY family protein n=1 Tax=Rhabdochromatium marinum TaxID=48729 RepID=UPI0019034A8E|nr:tetratricopeptide repeat protein [Rhabdochromatium marinum]MBK1647613.1 hypothetical protein [Rhabdochromatium marinum]